MILGAPRGVLIYTLWGTPIRDSIEKCPKESILMLPPKWFTKIFSIFPAIAYRIYRVPPLSPAHTHTNPHFFAVDNFFDCHNYFLDFTFKMWLRIPAEA